MKAKKWVLPASIGILLITLLAGVMIGKMLPGSGEAEETSDWLNETEDSAESGSLTQKNMELLGQIILLKKMLGEVDGEVVLLGPVGSYPISRGRLVWDASRMQGFIHAVQLKPATGKWYVDGYFQGKVVARCMVPAPDSEGILQEMFLPEKRLLSWDEFKLVRENEQGEQETVLVGKRSL